MKKICFKCRAEKDLDGFYKHPQMGDGHLGKCKECTKKDARVRTIKRKCLECLKEFMTWPTEIKRGGGLTCSRTCYYKRFIKIVGRDEASPNWKGDEVGKTALHNWVERKLGKPKKCEHCGDTKKGKYDWANKSQEYKRELSDWIRLCKACHAKYDYPTRLAKWRVKMKIIELNGENACFASKRLGGGSGLIHGRLRRGWTIEDAFTKKVIKKT